MKADFLASENHFLPVSATIFFHFYYSLKKQKKKVSTSQEIRFHKSKWRISLKKTLLLDGKQTITGKSLRKKREQKKISTSQNISCPLARMSSFSQNIFLLIPKNLKNWYPLARIWFIF